MYVVGRLRRHLEAVVLNGEYDVWCKVWHGMCVVGRQRRYIEAGVFASSGGLVGSVRSRVSACVP